MSLNRKHSGDFFKCIFTILLQIQHENNFLPTSKHRQAKVRRFLGICLYDCFIYRSNFVFRKCLETRRHLGSGRKTVNSQGYSELREPIKTREKVLFTDLVNTKIKINFQLCNWTIRQWSRKINQPSSESVSSRVTELEAKQRKWKIQG